MHSNLWGRGVHGMADSQIAQPGIAMASALSVPKRFCDLTFLHMKYGQ